MKTFDERLIKTREEKIDSCLISQNLDKKFFIKYLAISVSIFIIFFCLFKLDFLMEFVVKNK